MTASNADVVRRAYELLGEPGGLDRADQVADPEFVLDFSQMYPDGPVITGVQGLRHWRATESPWARELRFEIEELLPAGDDRVLALVVVRGEGEGGGVPVEVRAGHLVTLRDGLVVRWVLYSDRDLARAAAGLAS